MNSDSRCSNKVVCHYTALSNLGSILTRDGIKFWATRYGFLDDRLEFIWANQVIIPKLRSIAETYGEIFDPKHSLHPYIVSFTDLEDDLTMWRLFGNNGKGVCLSLDMNEIDIRKGAVAHMTVVYADESNIMDRIECAHRIYQKDYANESVAEEYREIAAFIKHDNYEVENEYRLVKFVAEGFTMTYNPAKKDLCKRKDFKELSDEIKFRQRGDMLIPYIEITLPCKALKRITIGNDCDYEQAKAAIELLADLHGYDVEIIRSSINKFCKEI